MNIFYLHDNPRICARYHNNKHVVKMILEYAQLLSTAHNVLDNETNSLLYKTTHENHPCSKWVRESDKNYMWLYELFISLLAEYTWRYGKIHTTQRLMKVLSVLPDNIPVTESITKRPVCVSENCKKYSILESYREYYKIDKKHIANWKHREIPKWYMEI
jgi:hypothetical protein